MSQSQFVAQIAINALALTSVYLMVALGLILIFGGLDIPNFAQGKSMAVSGFAAIYLLGSGMPLLVALPVALLLAAIWSVVLFVLVFRWLSGQHLAMFLVAFGVILAFQNVGNLIVGPLPRGLFLPNVPPIHVGGVYLPQLSLLLIFVALALWLLLWVALRTTVWGIRIRALGENGEVASLLGIPTGQVSLVAFAVAGLLGGVAGIFSSGMYGVAPDSDLEPLLVAFVAVVVGGLGSTAGAAIAAFVIALLQSLARAFGYGGWDDAIVFGALAVLLTLRPAGLVSVGVSRV